MVQPMPARRIISSFTGNIAAAAATVAVGEIQL